MSRKKSQRIQLLELVAKLESDLQRAFLSAIAELRMGVEYTDLIKALTAGDIDAAIEALRIEPAAFQAYAQAKTAAYVSAGQVTSSSMVGVPRVRFDMTNPRAENWITKNVAQNIVGVIEETKLAARDKILEGFRDGRHPNSIALDIAGRVVGGRRVDGIVGLDRPRQQRLSAVTEAIKTPEGIRSLVTKQKDGTLKLRYKVNRDAERKIIRAYKSGASIPPEGQKSIIRQYNNLLLKSRAENIARTETAQAVRSAQKESWQQLADRDGIPPEAIIKTWVYGGGAKDPRPHHRAMNGVSVRGLETDYELPNGVRMKHPNDPDAPISETASCTCTQIIRLDHAWGLR